MSSLPKPRPLAALVSDDRLSDEVRDVLRDAAAEATRLGHRLIGAEHVLIALIGVDTPTGSVLREARATAAQARSRVEFIVPHEPLPLAGAEMRVAPRLLVLLDDLAVVAEAMGAKVESPDVLLAFLRDRDGLPSRVLDECGVNTRALAQRTRLLQG